MLSDGEPNAAYYEHEWAATALGVPLVEPEELATRDDIDIVYRRTNADRLDTAVGRLLLEPCARAASASSTRSAPASPTTS